MKIIFVFNKKYWSRKLPEGGSQTPHRRALVYHGHLGPPPEPIFWYIVRFDLEKIKGGLSG